MSGRRNSDSTETLFSFELFVEFIRIDKESQVSDELALGVRLLDFPTLLIYQQQQDNVVTNQQGHNEEDQQGQHTFNRGKSCLFKMKVNSLHAHLCDAPLYAMVLDVKEDTPKLVGTSLISLAKVMDRIRQDVAEHGVSAPSSHGERGLVGVCSLTGRKIGSMSLSYKLLSLGASLLPHIAERSERLDRGHHVQESILERDMSAELLPPDCGDVCLPRQDTSDVNNRLLKENTSRNEEKQDSGKPRRQNLKEDSLEEDFSVFYPPHLFYCSSADAGSKNERGACRSVTLDEEAFTFEDTGSEEETAEGATFRPTDRRERHNVNMSRNLQTSGGTSNVLGEALRQLPLLNALLVELSQLNGQNSQQPLSVHPSLAWIYRSASTEPSAECADAEPEVQSKSLPKTRQGTAPHLKHFHSPRKCSTPVVRPMSVKVKDKQKEALIESRSSTKSKKKLVYGTTKTFDLRLKQISPFKAKRRECADLIQNQTQWNVAKEKTKSSNKIMKSRKRQSVLNHSCSLNENIETVIHSITVDSAPQETDSGKQENRYEKVHSKQDKYSQTVLGKSTPLERSLEFIRIPSVPRNTDGNEHHSQSNQPQSEPDRHRDKTESSGSSRRSSPKSSFSDSSGGGDEEADYADDFNSLEPSDAYSPDPASSPEPSRAKTPKSPISPDSEVLHRRAVLPVPLKAPSSPQRALRGTHIIRPRTHASALSFSSDDGDRDGSVSLQAVRSRKQMTESSRVETSAGGESFISWRGQRSESSKNSSPVRGFSADSVSSFEPQEAEELEDVLGSLDFRKEYQHISELVANKLPGYTM